MRTIFTLLLLLVLAAFAVPAGAEDGQKRCGSQTPFLGLDGLDPFEESDRNAKRLQPLAALGPVLVRTRPIPWGRIEPNAPRAGNPTYDWKALDEAMLLWPLVGLEPVLVLTPRSPWACVARGRTDWERAVRAKLPGAEGEAALHGVGGTPPPRGDAWHLWERFVRDVVERYDGDGRGDMPGLRRAVRRVQILDRAASPDAWLGSVEEYLRLLQHGGVGAKSAHTETCVLAATSDVGGTGYAPHPDAREWEFRIGRLKPAEAPLAALEVERGFAFLRGLVAMPLLFDVLPQAGADNHHEDVANLRFLRRHLDENEGKEIALWLVANPSRKLGSTAVPGAVKPKADELRVRRRWLSPGLNPAHGNHRKALRWLRRGQAFDVVRSLARARAAGADVILFRGPWDHAATLRSQGAGASFQGLLAEDPDAPPSEPMRPTGSLRALAQANGLLRGHRSAGESALGAPGRSVVFSFSKQPKRPWVTVLLLEERFSWAGVPGEALPKRAVTVPLPNGRYTLESCRLGEARATTRSVTVANGMLDLELGPAPVYVIPTP